MGEIGVRPSRLAWPTLGLVFIGSLLLIFARLGRESLLGDEAIYATVARDSTIASVWFPLEYDGQPYTGKPPLGIWAIQASYSVLGVSELAARLPAALAGVAALVLFGLWVSRRADAWTAALACGLLASGHHLLFRHGLRQAVLEGPLLLAMIMTAIALSDNRGRPWPKWAAILGGAFGAGVKGLAAPGLIVAVLLGYAPLRPRPERGPIVARGVSAAVAGALVHLSTVAAWSAHGVSDAWAGIRTDVFVRLTQGVDPGHLAGPGFYFELLWREFGPWLVLVPLAWPWLRFRGVSEVETDERRLRDLALAWSLGPLVLLTLSASKLSWYLYPALPGWALLVALGARRATIRLRGIGWLCGLVALLLAAGLADRFASRARRLLSDRPEQVPLRVLADSVAADPGAVVIFDRSLDPVAPPVREWHWFYLGQVIDRSLELESPIPEGRCAVVVTDDPTEAMARLGVGADRRFDIYQVTASERPLAVIDACDGRYVDRLRAVRSPTSPRGNSG